MYVQIGIGVLFIDASWSNYKKDIGGSVQWWLIWLSGLLFWSMTDFVYFHFSKYVSILGQFISWKIITAVRYTIICMFYFVVIEEYPVVLYT